MIPSLERRPAWLVGWLGEGGPGNNEFPGFDLSETASTLRRSSPFEADETRNTLWDFGETPMRRSPSDFAAYFSEANDQCRSHLVERHPNTQRIDDEQNASEKMAFMTSWTKGSRPRSTLAETKQHDEKEVKAPHQDGTDGELNSARGAPCSESHTTGFQAVTHGSQRAKIHEARRTLSVSELGSPVRLRRSQRGDPVGFAQIAKSESSESEDEIDQALARESRKRGHQNVRRQLVFSLRPPGAVPAHVASRSAVGPYPAKATGSKTKATNIHKQVQNLPDPFRIPDVQDKIQEQMSASLAPQQHVNEGPSHGHCSSSHRKCSSKGPQKPLRDGHGSEIARELHGVVDMMTEHLSRANRTVDGVLEAYTVGTSGCVERIERRVNREQKTLKKRYDDDSKQFVQEVDTSKKAIQKGNSKREKALSQQDEEAAERQVLYKRASSSVQAFQNTALGGRSLGKGGV
ncbi:hypothetical protein ACRE_003400 [Hapsidospora chrysogenum ATCC 11550]|uniref:Uncharacterized protein n=1 Tax=Hapsidospora chrysogenum (strain ATCC 11550 / CBS 779.69 / DSM 880 / IAM 14645 / JCM 23072 / IMI 49137) TaxID=857340 RepID=A0A086TH94_HAPC1|nr:hypothetical protein ACRE_003400 [Hapsidospora chrysogenum ATCC 11550]